MEINELFSIVMIFIVTGVGIAFGLSILGDSKVDFSETGCPTGYTWQQAGYCWKNSNHSIHTAPNSAEYNATVNSIDAVVKFPEKMGLLATVLIAGLIIGVLVKYLYLNNK